MPRPLPTLAALLCAGTMAWAAPQGIVPAPTVAQLAAVVAHLTSREIPSTDGLADRDATAFATLAA